MEQRFVFDEAVFTYAISKGDEPLFSRHVPLFGGSLWLHHTAATEVRMACCSVGEVAVVGFCVDSHGELTREEIPGWLANLAVEGIDVLYRASARLAGKYVLCCRSKDGDYLVGDATASIPIHYSFSSGHLTAASTDQLTARIDSLELSAEAVELRAYSDWMQGLPDDMTMFEHVRALLPNHWLDLNAQKAVRIPLEILPAGGGTERKEIISRSAFLIRNITREILLAYDVMCPLTAGYDSRVSLAFLRKERADQPCYTFRHEGFTDETEDLKIATQICAQLGLSHAELPDVPMPKAMAEHIFYYAGKYNSERTLSHVYTYGSAFRGKALVNGDIIGQVGKSSISNAVPNRFATAGFFQCKMHNTAPQMRANLQHWMDGVKAAGDGRWMCDLFAVENRCGRWAPQSGTLYGLAGITVLNQFNCAELIRLWMSVDRRLRVEQYLHRQLLEQESPELLKFPFNAATKTDVFRKSPWLFLIATHGKFLLQRLRG